MSETELSPEQENQLDGFLAECLECLDAGGDPAVVVFPHVPDRFVPHLERFLSAEKELRVAAEQSGLSTQTDSSTAREENSPQETHDLSTVEFLPAKTPEDPTNPQTENDLGAIGDFELLEELGRGGMGVVYRARQIQLDRIVAVKMILAGRMASEVELQRFYSEARAVAQLRHPNIVPIYNVQEAKGHHFFAMDYIEGSTLDDIARARTLSEREIARYLNLIAEAVEYAHQNGILHRDLKPTNVLVDANDQPHVTDFGLAKKLESNSALTLSGTILGTPSYMSPEQAEGRNEDVGAVSDVYSLGATLYFLLTGKPPFSGRTAAETITMVIHQEPHPVRSYNPRISRSMAIICEKCLRKNPAERYQSAQEVAVELERFLRGDPIQAQPASRLRKLWIWSREIPIVAALIGRTPAPENRWQTRFQWVLMCVLFVLISYSLVSRVRSEFLPRQLRIAAGFPEGMYDGVSRELAKRFEASTPSRVEVISTRGSLENLGRLVSQEAHLGLLQASAVDVEQIAVVAPLYREYVHLIVRIDSEAMTIADLQGKTIVTGPEGSGNRASAERILGYFDITAKTSVFSEEPFPAIRDNSALDAAVVVSGLENAALIDLLSLGEFRLLSIPPREKIFLETGFYPATMKASYDQEALPAEEIPTVVTAALLVVRKGERDVIVTTACEMLTEDNWLQTVSGHFTPESFHYLTKSLPMHPAAVRFFKTHEQFID